MSIPVDQILPQGFAPSPPHADVILEIAYLTTAADGRLTNEELDAFRALAAKLKKVPTLPDSDLDTLLDRFASRIEHAEITDRLHELGQKLDCDHADVAYKLSVAMSLADLDASAEESEFDAELIDALKLTQDRADTLTGEVYEMLDSGTDE